MNMCDAADSVNWLYDYVHLPKHYGNDNNHACDTRQERQRDNILMGRTAIVLDEHDMEIVLDFVLIDPKVWPPIRKRRVCEMATSKKVVGK